MGKGEIALTSNFSSTHKCFQKACFPGASKGVIVWEWVKLHFECAISVVLIPSDMAFIHTCNVGSFLLTMQLSAANKFYGFQYGLKYTVKVYCIP